MKKRLVSEVSEYLLSCILDGLHACNGGGKTTLGGNNIEGMSTGGVKERASNNSFDSFDVRSALIHMERAGLIEATWHLTKEGRAAQKTVGDRVREVIEEVE